MCAAARSTPSLRAFCISFFVTAAPPSATYTLSLHDALPISLAAAAVIAGGASVYCCLTVNPGYWGLSSSVYQDRKSTRLNSSHRCISYAVFCLKKKNVGGFRLDRQRAAEADERLGRDSGGAA